MDQEVISFLENKIREHQLIVDRLKRSLETFKGNNFHADTTSKSFGVSSGSLKMSTTIKKGGVTMREIILESLSQSKRLLTAREILEHVRMHKGSSFSYKSLSPQLSSQVGKVIFKLEVRSNSTQNRFYYGLNEWKNGNGEVKEEFRLNENELPLGSS